MNVTAPGITAGIFVSDRSIRYSAVDHSAAPTLIRLGSCDFDFNLVDELHGESDSSVSVLKDAVSDVLDVDQDAIHPPPELGQGIDVAFMARERTMDGEPIEIDRIRSHAKSTFSDLGVHNATLEEMGLEADERIFRRDCLEGNLRVGGRRVTLFVCHFKSMGPFRNGMTGREYTTPVRIAESRAVKRIIERKFGSERTPKMRWVIVGDLNDYTERLVVTGDRIKGYSFENKREGVSGIDPLLTDGFSHNLMDLRPADDRWTLYHAAGPVDDLQKPEERETRHLVQLDYLLLSPALAKQNAKSVPEVIRQGLPFRTIFPPHLDVPRYPRTGWDRPKASDHCPVVMKLTL